MPAAIEVKDISKKFNIYRDRANTLKERAIFWNRQRIEEFWALRHVDITIPRGATVGLIGGNGNGKSTLLKIISKIFYPTTGQVIVNGRVATLLELGTGFHPDFSGRENIYLNASISGLSRREIDKRMTEIIEFAELEEFIDSPVRNYSSGMYMRLGFSISVHVDPDILLVDEVLAVGDVAFQKKCLEKINEFRRSGKTIVFVTHDMVLVQRICDSVVWLRDGMVVAEGSPMDVINKYLDSVASSEEQRMLREHQKKEDRAKFEISDSTPAAVGHEQDLEAGTVLPKPERWGSQSIKLTEVKMLNQAGEENYSFECGQPVTIVARYEIRAKVDDLVFGVGFFRDDGVQCYGTNTDIDRFKFKVDISSPAGVVECRVSNLYLLEGKYFLDIAAHTKDGLPYDYWKKCLDFRVFSRIPDAGITRLEHSWTITQIPASVNEDGGK
jgi:ABC-type polysaccharide/polyol phosphate transport system ATPase subunit